MSFNSETASGSSMLGTQHAFECFHHQRRSHPDWRRKTRERCSFPSYVILVNLVLQTAIGKMDIFEIYKAFISIVLAWQKEFGGDMQRGNPNSDAIAHGHPLGATGAVLLTKFVHALQDKKLHYGLQAMCIGHGMAMTTVIERV